MKRASTDLWPEPGYFKKRCCDEFSLLKANFRKHTLYYLNQGALSYKSDEKMFYSENFILGQIVPLANVSSDLRPHGLKSDEVKILKTKYNTQLVSFLESSKALVS